MNGLILLISLSRIETGCSCLIFYICSNYLDYGCHSFSLIHPQEDRGNVLRARESGKAVLTAPFRLLKTNRLGVILTFAVYKKDLPSNATPNERIQATDGYA